MTSLARLLVLVVALVGIGTDRPAASSAAPEGAITSATVPSVVPQGQREAPHVRGALDPGNGSQTGNSSENLVTTAPTTGGASPSPTGQVGSVLTGTPADVTWQGIFSFVDRSFGPRYLALPLPVGTTARICGPAACLTRTSTDYGPDQRVHPERIADLSAADFETVCGVPTSFGLCPGSVTIERRAVLPTLPPTSTAP